ncbi:uncharacterized protein LOC126780588 [Nymphalis io]|uniref:uncharacterized protein LOC126780588 n=1 Tax=Inachis io TaxID=171585 RepID=UPI002167921E|nr:uncharacterized protein LOC126780588 [Nymphalis io]
MNDCQNLAVSMFFQPDWLECLLEDCEREAIDYQNVKLLKLEGRSAIWNVCMMLDCLSHGVPGQACHLFERYLYRLLNNQGNLSDPQSRVAIIENIMPRFLLMITCCVQLSAKMSSADTHNHASLLKMALLAKGVLYSTEEIIATEEEIFKMLDFRIPLWTSVDMGELLATELKLPSHIIKAVARIVDLSEYYREDIEKKVVWAANLSSTYQNITSIRSLHLSAGSVAAAVRLSPLRPDVAPALARLLRIPQAYVECLRDVILKQMTSHRTTPTILKRKKSASS